MMYNFFSAIIVHGIIGTGDIGLLVQDGLVQVACIILAMKTILAVVVLQSRVCHSSTSFLHGQASDVCRRHPG